MNKAFLSYSRKDKAFAQTLVEAFIQHDYQVWVDWEDIPPNADWWQEIETGIEQAESFVCVLSQDYVRSDVCRREIEYALKHHKRLVPIVCRNDFPVNDAHTEIAKLNWIFFSLPENFAKHFESLLDALNTDLDHVRTHTRLLTRALEWADKQEEKSLLLRGRELNSAGEWLCGSSHLEPKPTLLQMQYVSKSSHAQSGRQRRTLFAVSVGLIIMVALTIVADQSRRYAIEQRHRAIKSEIIALDSLSRASLATHDQLGALLAGVQATKYLRQLKKPTSKSALEETQALSKSTLEALRKVMLWIHETNRIYQAHTDTIQSIAFSPDGLLFASAGSDRRIKVWQKNGQLLYSFDNLESKARHVSFSPQGKTFATILANGKIDLRDLTGGRLIRSWQHGGPGQTLTFTPSGNQLISGGVDKKIRIWDLQGQLLNTLEGHAETISEVAVSPDKQWLASASFDRTVKIWRFADGQLFQTIRGHQGRVYGVDFSPESDLLASAGGDNTAKLWEFRDNQWQLKTTLSDHTNWVYSVHFNPDDETVATAGADNAVRLWDREGTLLQTFYNHSSSAGAKEIAFSPHHKTIAIAGLDKTIRFHNLAGSLIGVLQGHHSSLKDVVFSPDGKWIASVSHDTDYPLKLWHSDGTLLKSIHSSIGLRGVQFSPDSQFFVTAGYNGDIYLWRRTGELEQHWHAHESIVKAVTFSPDGQLLASVSPDRLIKLWTLTGELVATIAGHEDEINDISFSPDGRLLASAGSDKTIKLWQRDGQFIKTLKGHEDWVNTVVFSPDGRYLISASSDRTVKLWTVAEGQLVRTFQGHEDWVWQAEMSPDGKMIASASSDGTVKLWNVEGPLLFTLEEHKGWVRALSFSPNGKKLATAGADRIIILWDLELLKQIQSANLNEKMDDLLERGCQWLHDYLAANSPPFISLEEKKVCD